MRKICLLVIVILAASLQSKAQSPVDSTARVHSVKKATWLSAALPGAGQVYNHKVWKVPIVYGGLAAMGYFIKTNADKYKKYNDALIKRYDADPNNEELTNITSENLRLLSDNYHRNRDLSIAGAVFVYLLNIIDAHVDAHLYTFNVDDNLSLNIQPSIESNPYSTIAFQPGLRLAVSFK